MTDDLLDLTGWTAVCAWLGALTLAVCAMVLLLIVWGITADAWDQIRDAIDTRRWERQMANADDWDDEPLDDAMRNYGGRS